MARIIPEKESLTVEFKSDKKRLPDRDLLETLICPANTEGGDIYLGIEKDGTPTGLHSEHMDVSGMSAMIANKTIPSISVRVEVIKCEDMLVARVNVPKSTRIVSTSEGVLKRRRIMADGQPQCIPFYPHEFIQRSADLGLLDHSAMPVENSSPDDFDPLERERLKQMIDRYGGDSSLLGLADKDLDGALGFVKRIDGRLVPTLAGLLVLGRTQVLREKIPAHEAAFQVLEDTSVKVNDFYRMPLLKSFERIMEQFEARLVEEEIQEKLFRVPVPNYEKRAFREALVNALIHRDYSRLGAVHVRMGNDGLVISNPGGFIEGVTLENLLVVEPKPRNPLLADIVKRIGLAERTGRGVDLIYYGMLRYGRPVPDYSGSDHTTVAVRLSSAEPDTDFLRMIISAEEKTGTRMPLESLIALARLRVERRLDVHELASAIQKNEFAARAVLERLAEAGFVTAHGVKKGRTYTLSASVYQKMGITAGYVRQAGFDSIQHEQMIVNFIRQRKRIQRQEVVDLCQIGPYQATRLLDKLVKAKNLKRLGQKRGVYYELNNGINERAQNK